jgi:molybdopterin-guanine dinucleotide biosynthesis protein A
MVSISIQAGGQSSRMGQDKALLPFLGQPLIKRVLDRVQHLSDDIFVTTNQTSGYEFLSIPLVPDIKPGLGALGGLYTALKSARHSVVAVVACDMPFINPELLVICSDILINSDFDAVIPSTPNGLEPIHAVYRQGTCLPPIENALDAGKRRMIAWHHEVNVKILSPQETMAFDPNQLTFWNVNTPEEFKRAEEKAQTLENG